MNRAGGISLTRRLLLAFGLVLGLVVALLVLSLVAQAEATRIQRHVLHVTLPRSEAAAALERSLHRQDLAARRFLAKRSSLNLEEHTDASAEVQAALDRIRAFPEPKHGRNVLHEMSDLALHHAERSEALIALAREEADEAAVIAAANRLADVHGDLASLAKEFADLQVQRAERALAELSAAQSRVARNLLSMGLLVFVLGALASFHTVRRIRDPLRRLSEATRAIGENEFGPGLALAKSLGVDDVDRPIVLKEGGDEIAELAQAFGRTVALLVDRQERLAADARLASALAVNTLSSDLAGESLREICAHTRCQLGAVYLLDEEAGRLSRLAGFAAEGTPESFALGEGLVGEAASGRRAVSVETPETDSPFTLRLGPEDLPPRAILAVPIVTGEAVLGVVLLASIMPLRPSARRFVEEAAPSLGVSLRSALGQEQVRRLVDVLRERNEEIQAQNEELQSQREEILAQNEELVAQSEEIQAHNDLLAESDRRKNDFLALLGHELRNPLAAVVHAAALLERLPPEDEKAGRFRDIITRQTRQLVRLVDDLLDVARIDNGKVTLERRRLPLAEVVTRAVDTHAATLEEKGHRIEVLHPERPIVLAADPHRLEQIVSNLVHNAVNYTPEGGRIRIETAAEDGSAEIRIRDDGIGFDAEVAERIFRPFDQARPEGERAGGLGLGLTLVRKLTELHGGHVSAHSDGPGRGAEFVIRIPLEAPDAPAASEEPAVEAAQALRVSVGERSDEVETGEAARPRELRILVVDDDVDAASTLEELLSEWGHRVETVHDGREALEAALDHRPHVALVDIALPGMDGYEVARRLRDQPSLSRTVLAAVTGYGQAEARARSERAGFDVHLTKPVLPERLETFLAQVAEKTVPAERAG